MIILKKRNKKLWEDIVCMFISLDAERDTPKIVKEYCAVYFEELQGFIVEPEARE